MTGSLPPLLAIPPFPGARLPVFARRRSGPAPGSDARALLARLAETRVGGCYWGHQPARPAPGFRLDGSAVPAPGHVAWPADVDPWHLLDGAAAVRLASDDPRLLLAVAADVPVTLLDPDRPAAPSDIARLIDATLTGWDWQDPFDGRTLTVVEAIDLAGFWRRLIDANRPIVAALGFAYWKKPTVAPLLWGGDRVPFDRLPDTPDPSGPVAIWRSRLSTVQADAIAASAPPLLEVEDGFIRSTGLGADCVPPLSIIVDALGVHFDPTRPSDLERLLATADLPPALIARAAALRQAIVAAGLSKYAGGGTTALPRPGGDRRHILVPGQVEDDRAVTSGGALPSNHELLRRARAEAGEDAFVIYKPHPDVLAGHRRGAVDDRAVRALADHVETRAPIPALIDMVDELHVNSSLAGFEALLRGKPVTVHGMPFYAGWGLTRDRGQVPARRGRRRSLDELVAAALLLYPRYLDPISGLPCPAEVLVARLSAPVPVAGLAGTIVTARRWQGRVRRLATGWRRA